MKFLIMISLVCIGFTNAQDKNRTITINTGNGYKNGVIYIGGGKGEISSVVNDKPDKKIVINVSGNGSNWPPISSEIQEMLGSIDCNNIRKDIPLEETPEGQCGRLHSRCYALAAVNPWGNPQCCEGLHCQISIFEGILWPTFACSNIKEKLGMGNYEKEHREAELKRRRDICVLAGRLQPK